MSIKEALLFSFLFFTSIPAGSYIPTRDTQVRVNPQNQRKANGIPREENTYESFFKRSHKYFLGAKGMTRNTLRNILQQRRRKEWKRR